ncbi:putative ribonuclease H-like domain-containing protein [Rosa chinensis]|uniref:Putative ribonuclease H-like domain-containing protein n=1 Tax=Rosa chinensis TaxID=74649 RepID=A0A2P6S8R3_ROSCH|nr:putative ribonuclease H-like domain-containing protein [Rosa chinensis]
MLRTASSGLGDTLRDAEGSFLGGFMHFVEDVHSAKQAELLACLYGARIALERGWRPLIIESDCLEVVTEVDSSSDCLSMLGVLVEDLREVLVLLSSARLVHTRRPANQVAHILAQEAYQLQDVSIFFGCCSPVCGGCFKL